QELDRDRLAEGLVHGLVHDAHAAFAELAHDAVAVGDQRTDQRIVLGGFGGQARAPARARADERRRATAKASAAPAPSRARASGGSGGLGRGANGTGGAAAGHEFSGAVATT